ncbi:MAG: tetratricopeptide repeat protein [Rhodoferax sp.]|uniref:tetratricopeptide repeat protein n=1 Tax=Rhodoferax sp. TaxID=50421 RepID=UPI00273260D4|nr:tetratricopeptide repeat protein [Rhodoferax sp.]MDP2679953.1 tetratricopeptide repeat protein [Rhodoferax sp.]
MSLLLDALNRASRDKAAAAQSHSNQPTSRVDPAVPMSLAVEPQIFPSPPEPVMAAPTTAPSWPALELEPPQAFLTEVPAPETPMPELQPPEAVATFESPVFGVALPTAVMPDPEPAPAAPVEAPTLSLTQKLAEPQLFTVSEPTLSEPLVTVSSSSPMATPASAETMGGGTRAAQNLLRAKAPPTPAGKKRVLVLVSVAMVLATALGSVMLGVWGDPMALVPGFGTPTQILAVTPPPLAPEPPADSQTVVLANAVAPAVDPVSEPAEALPPMAAPMRAPAPKPKSAPSRPPVRDRVAANMTASASALTCPPGTLPPDCRAPTKKVPASAPVTAPVTGQASVQTRLSGPSALEQGYNALVQGRLQEAGQAYEQALSKNPEERDALLGLAYIAQQQGRHDAAQGFYKRVLRQDPGNPSARAGLLMLNQPGDLQDFGNRSRDVAEQNPESAAAQSVLGHALVRQDRLADARLAFSRAQQLEPNVARHAFNLAVALDRLHRYDEARQYYERAVALAMQVGSDQASGFALADAQTRLGQLRSVSQTTGQAMPN